MIKLHSEEIERACISSSINFQEDVVDVLTFIHEDHFYFRAHKTIFLVIKNFVISGQKFDRVILTDRIKGMGLSKVEDIDIADYINALSSISAVKRENFLDYFKTLHKFHNARTLVKTSEEIAEFVRKNIGGTSQELIGGAESIFSKKIEAYSNDEDPVDMLDGLKERIELLGNEPREDGIKNPYPVFQRFYGDLPDGRVIFIAAPTGIGKTTLLQDMMRKITVPGEIIALYLDSELTKEQEQTRLVSSLSGVKEYYISTGKYRYDAGMLAKVRAIWPEIEKRKKTCFHKYIGRKNIDEVISICRRFKYKHHDKRIVIFYDYLKAKTGMTNGFESFAQMQDEADKIKVLSNELKCPIIVAGQINNRSNELALSSGIENVVDIMAFLFKKTAEEIARDGNNFGTHKLTIRKSRMQGADAPGFQDICKLPSGEWERLYINYDFQNFSVEEKGCLLDVIDMLNGNVPLPASKPTDDGEVF